MFCDKHKPDQQVRTEFKILKWIKYNLKKEEQPDIIVLS